MWQVCVGEKWKWEEAQCGYRNKNMLPNSENIRPTFPNLSIRCGLGWFELFFCVDKCCWLFTCLRFGTRHRTMSTPPTRTVIQDLPPKGGFPSVRYVYLWCNPLNSVGSRRGLSQQTENRKKITHRNSNHFHADDMSRLSSSHSKRCWPVNNMWWLCRYKQVAVRRGPPGFMIVAAAVGITAYGMYNLVQHKHDDRYQKLGDFSSRYE